MLLVVALEFDGGKISAADSVADRDALESMELEELERRT
jgi:hypothetical protein